MGKDKENSVAEEFVVTAVEKIGMDMDSIKDSIAGIAGKFINLERKYSELKTGEEQMDAILERHSAATAKAASAAVGNAFANNRVKVNVPPPLPATLSKEDSDRLERLEENLEPKVVKCHDKECFTVALLFAILAASLVVTDICNRNNDYRNRTARSSTGRCSRRRGMSSSRQTGASSLSGKPRSTLAGKDGSW